MKYLTILLLFGATLIAQPRQICGCSPASQTQQTVWGHENNVFDFQAEPLKAVKGTVMPVVGRSPIEGALVEVYRYLENGPVPTQAYREGGSGPRLSACITDGTGKFKFNVPSGRYEVRISKQDWNSTSILVVVDARKGKRRPLLVRLEVGT